MNTQRLTSTYYDWTHGWHGLFVLYLVVAVFSLAGLKRGRASLQQFFFWPFTSVLTMVVVGLLLELSGWILGKFNLQLIGIYRDLFSVIFIMMGGGIGGLY